MIRQNVWKGEVIKLLLKTFRVIVGNMGIYTNSYLVSDKDTKDSILIDVAGDIDKIYNYIENSGMKLKYIVLTHCHADHISGLSTIKRYYNEAKIIIHENDSEGLTSDNINLCSLVEIEENFISADIIVKDNEIIKFGNLEAKCLHTPGHTSGSMCILIGDALFSGDTLFKRAWGRTDLPTSDFNSIIRSIENKLVILPENTIVYPGHGLPTIIGEEKKLYTELRNV